MIQRKGFVHAVEGVIAALLLLTYLATIDFQPIERADWRSNALKQTGSEYLSSFNRANLSKMIYEENGAAAAEINRYFFAGTRVSMASESIPKQKIRAGIISDYTKDPEMYFNAAPITESGIGGCDDRGWNTEYLCIINDSATNPLGKNIILADTDGGTPNARLDYDAVYVDLNSNNLYDSNEGPFVANSVFGLGSDFYSVSYIDNSTKSAVFLNASWAITFASNILPANINGRNISFEFSPALAKRNISVFDAIVIVGKTNISAYEQNLRNFLQQGGGIVEISNITDENFNSAQKSIFGISRVTYGVIGNSDAAKFNGNATIMDPVGIKDYFAGTAMNIDVPTKVEDTVGYDVRALPSNESVRLGVFNVSGAIQNVALANSTQSYDSFFVDSNNDKNFSRPASDSIVYRAGNTFNISQNTYFIRKIDSAGSYLEVRPFDNHTFLQVNGAQDIFLWDGGGQSVLEWENYHNISTNLRGSVFSVDFYPAPVRGNPANLPPGTHTYAQLNRTNGNFGPFAFNVSLTNVTGRYDMINIDQGYGTYANVYLGFGEGPFSNGEVIAIGPEQYRVNISWDGTLASFRLEKRRAVPASAAKYLYAGRTAWMQDITNGRQDSWNYIKAAIIWVSDKKPEPENVRAIKDIVSIKQVFVSSGDMYLPYEVNAKFGHWG